MSQLVVRGHVLTVDDDRRVLTDGAVYVNDGRIEAVADGSAAPPAGYKGVPRLRVDVVAPGPHRPAQPPRVQHAAAVAGASRSRTGRATSGRARRRTGPTSRTPRRRSASPRRPPRCGSRR